MPLEPRCRTTAMGIMPHTDVEAALRLALSLDIPFWPQLPRISFYEDMYAQASENFPGMTVDVDKKKLGFDTERFHRELERYSQTVDTPRVFTMGRAYSAVYHRFLEEDLRGYHAVRGQVTGPISLGFNVLDENRKPVLYNDDVRTLLFDFIQRKVNVQYHQLKEKNPNAFVWVDEPGLNFVFSGLSGYNDVHAREDYRSFLAGFDGPRALHLCPNVNLAYLLGLGLDILSFDAYQIEFMPREYAAAVADFVESGRVISWGIVPTTAAALGVETAGTLAGRLTDYWEVVSQNAGIAVRRVAEQALVAPARCCVRDLAIEGQAGMPTETEEEKVGRAFALLGDISRILRRQFEL